MRKKRQYSEKGFYHTVIRGCNKQNIFYCDEDKNKFINLMKRYSVKNNIRIHSYCLMDNHVHLLIEDVNKENLSSFMQVLSSVYARYFNKKYDRIGHLFQDRFSSEAIEDNGYLLVVFRYIMQNPQKAKVCNADKYFWSSYNCYKHQKTFVYKSFLINCFGSISKLYKYLAQENNDECLEIEMRPSEKNDYCIKKVLNILKSTNPIIQPDLPKEVLFNKLRLLKLSGLSLRMISRITGISYYLVQKA